MALKTAKNAKICRRNAELRTMTEKIIQKIIKLMGLILVVMLVVIDRIYTGVLIARILYAKKMWHVEFGEDDLSRDPSVNKMSDLMDKLDRKE